VSTARRPSDAPVLVLITGIFIVLGVSLTGLVSWYRKDALEPRLENEARASAEILARSQAGFLAGELRSGTGRELQRAVSTAMDELLLLQDADTKTPYFRRIELRVEYDAVPASPGSLDRTWGDPADAAEVFTVNVPIKDPVSDELLGLATFHVNDRFFRQLSGDVRGELQRVSWAVLALLVVLWATLVTVLRTLQRQTLRRHEAERELSQQAERYQRLVNSLSSYFVYRRDAMGGVTFVSDSIARVLGVTPADFLATHAEGLQIPAQAGSTSLRGERTFEVDLVDRQGARHRVELSEVPVRGERNELAAYDGIAHDVTAQRALEEELRHAKDQAEAANRAKSHFLANMSHEIRTPLNAILGMTGLALRIVASPKQRDYLEKIRASGRLLVEIIEDILDLSRIEAGRLEIQHAEFDLDELLAELADVVSVRTGAKGLEVLLVPRHDVPRRLSGDAVRLKQVLLNLMNNAVKFTDSGEIVVSIVPVEVRRDRAVIRFSVRDTGIGIAPEHLSTLFEPFTQVDASSTRRYGGAGLGLAISRRLVRLMGGELHVESETGQGSTFAFSATFDLPRGPSGPRMLSQELREVPVLVADDLASARSALGAMLETLSCRVTAVATGEEAVAEVDRAAREGQPFRLAVIDWQMPGLDGVQTAARLAGASHSPKVILVTAYDWEEASRLAGSAGISVVLHKPVSPSALHDAVVHALVPGGALRRREASRLDVRFASGQDVLLVEDHPINRELARELLGQAGLQVTEACNGVEALERLSERKFDAVLMDVQMPDMDGLEAVRLIRDREDLAGLPVIAMTAHAMLGDRERFLEAGMSDYVAKPIEEAELFRVLARWLEVEAGAVLPGPEAQGGLPASVPGLDVAAGLRRVGGKAELYRRILGGVLRDLDAAAPRLRALLDAGDTAAVSRLLHTLKGTSGTVGADRVAEAAAAMEAALKAVPGTRPGLDEIAAAIDEVRRGATELRPPAAERAPVEDAPLPAANVAHVALGIVSRLAGYLATSNLEATVCVAELKNILGPSLGDAIGELEVCVDRLDFAAAASRLDEIRTSLAEVAAP
jgi:two-component system, sensor histidine kinase and response regulator